MTYVSPKSFFPKPSDHVEIGYIRREIAGEKLHVCLLLAVSLCSNNSVPSAHRVTHHLCVSDSQSGLFSGLSQSSRPVVHLFLGTIFHQHDVFKSFLIFALKSLLLLILSLHPQACQHYLLMQRASIFMLPFDSHHYTLSSGSFILCVKPE